MGRPARSWRNYLVKVEARGITDGDCLGRRNGNTVRGTAPTKVIALEDVCERERIFSTEYFAEPII